MVALILLVKMPSECRMRCPWRVIIGVVALKTCNRIWKAVLTVDRAPSASLLVAFDSVVVAHSAVERRKRSVAMLLLSIIHVRKVVPLLINSSSRIILSSIFLIKFNFLAHLNDVRSQSTLSKLLAVWISAHSSTRNATIYSIQHRSVATILSIIPFSVLLFVIFDINAFLPQAKEEIARDLE